MTSIEDDPRDVEALARDAADGDRDALETLLTRLLPDLRAFVRLRAGHMVRRHDQHSDIVQSVCREVLDRADQFQHPGEGAFRRWLFTTTLRKLSERREYHTAGQRDAVNAALGSTDQSQLLEAYGRIATPSNQAAVREELERIEAAMAELDEQDRAIIVLARIAQVPRDEIARELDIGVGAVRMRLHRALARLAVVMERGEEK
ncbi:MAG: sigma-70 family RNA polymerase sigma factor [Planctomycetota bacterium]